MSSIPDVNDDELYNVKSIKINNEEIRKNIEIKSNPYAEADNSRYNIKFVCDYKISINSNEKKEIYIETISKVPESDPTYSHRVSHPCKKYTARIFSKTNQYNIDAYAFALDDNNTHKTQRIRRSAKEDIIEVNLHDWILPGDGILLFFSKT